MFLVKPEDTLSATQIDTFQDCERKWAWDKIEGVERGENRFASWGVDAHSMLERYLGKGIPLDLTTDVGEALMAGIHYFPHPGTHGMTVEGEFLLKGWNHLYYGKKDVQIAGTIPIPKVFDLKTTTNFRYAHTPESLKTNVQAALYATQAMVQTGSGVCDLRWVYVKSRKPWGSKPVDVRVTRAELTPTLTRIKVLSDRMLAIKRAGKRALELEPNPEVCEKYGGCPYKDHCNLSPIERMQALMSDQKQAFLDQINSMVQQGGGAGAAINPPPPPPSAFVPPPQPGQAMFTPPPQPGQVPPPPPAQMAPPPPPPPPAPAFSLPAGGQLSADGKSYWAPGMPQWAPVPEQNAAPMPPPATDAPANGKGKGGGRPAGSKNKPKAPESKADAYQMIAAGFSALAELDAAD